MNQIPPAALLTYVQAAARSRRTVSKSQWSKTSEGRSMKPFITSQPDVVRTRFNSSFDPVLSGVARGLARLFPPVQNVRPPRDGGETAAAPRQAGTAGGQDGRG